MSPETESALHRLIHHAFDTDIYHVVASKDDFQSVDDWIYFILADTAYGAALLVHSMTPEERLDHLHTLWNESTLHPMD